MFLSLPHHNHADPEVPQEEISCTAFHPGSQTFHLHRAGQVLDAYPCLACLAGSTFATIWRGVPAAPTAVAALAGVFTWPGCRSGIHGHLPDLRAPPRVV